ncbi:hypothetical protein MMC06_001052 [Schaereria dolodes]|nr:hypothetical protein [Schaereria dolodes]
MSYHTVPQRESDTSPDVADSHTTQFRSLSPDVEHVRSMNVAEDKSNDRLSSMIRSMLSAGPSYELIDGDMPHEHVEYDCENNEGSFGAVLSNMSDVFSHSRDLDESITSPTPLSYEAMRVVSREGSVRLRHPTPDLQSLQGAYLGNVERLERSAERLSMSSNIGEELRKIRMEQKRSNSRASSVITTQLDQGINQPPTSRQFSTSSNTSNSIISLNSAARSGGLSTNGLVTSPVDSFRSPSWSHRSVRGPSASQRSRLTQLSEPEYEGRPLDSPLSSKSISTTNISQYSPNSSHIANSFPNNKQEHIEIAETASHEHDMELQIQNGLAPGEALDRSATVASTDTYRHVTGLFADFDGVHISPDSRIVQTEDHVASRIVASNKALLASRPQSNADPSSGNMVYYPAPVPMMLNLPQKLSKLPAAVQRDKRRSQLLGPLPSDVRKSAVWLPGVLEANNEGDAAAPQNEQQSPKEHPQKSLATLPPQLRASIFFEHPAVSQTIKVKESSAVATLDSILDASAHAPISAFTDHPLTGHLGGDIYRKSVTNTSSGNLVALKEESRKSRSTLNLLKHRQSNANIIDDETRPDNALTDPGNWQPQLGDSSFRDEGEGQDTDRQTVPRGIAADSASGPEVLAPDQEFYETQEDLDAKEFADGAEYNGPPTTLLAELQLRKQQQKQRNRTAATSFPNGMHSTLLELDAVAQVQKKSRRDNHITLAWEDPHVQHSGSKKEDDEDIPLGLLFPGRKVLAYDKGARFDDDVPLGLIARRDMEDNEPLSHRRARLRGEDPLPQRRGLNKQASVNTLGIPQSTDVHDNTGVEDNEALGQSSRRLRGPLGTSNIRPVNSEFASEIMSHFGALPELKTRKAGTTDKTLEPEEETLGQRRKRLQAEREALSRDVSGNSTNVTRSVAGKRHSLADILQAHPVAGARTASYEAVSIPIPNGVRRHSQAVDGLLQRHEQLEFQKGQQASNQMPWSAHHNSAAGYGRERPVFMGQRMSSGNIPMAAGFGMFPFNDGEMVGFNRYPGILSNGGVGMVSSGQDQLPSDLKQRDMIDRWRQSVMH